MTDQNRLLGAWLNAYVAGVSASPTGIVRGDMLDAALVASGVIAPFAAPGPDGAARFGVPTRVTPDLLCDNASELLRMAAGALVSLYVFHNFVQRSPDFPPDEVVLIFSTIAIQSCADAANAAAIDAELASLVTRSAADGSNAGAGSSAAPGVSGDVPGAEAVAASAPSSAAAFAATPALRCAQVRWLMHWVRSMAMAQMGAAAFLVGNEERQLECMQCMHKDHQSMVAVWKDNPVGYSLYAASCMNFQQMPAAVAFLRRGLDVAAAQRDDQGEVAMAYQLAVALLLGGNGADVSSDEVLGLMRRGEAAGESLSAWWPPAWAAVAWTGEPNRSLLVGRLLGELEAQGAGELLPGTCVKALQGLLYVTQTPKSVVPGALVA